MKRWIVVDSEGAAHDVRANSMGTDGDTVTFARDRRAYQAHARTEIVAIFTAPASVRLDDRPEAEWPTDHQFGFNAPRLDPMPPPARLTCKYCQGSGRRSVEAGHFNGCIPCKGTGWEPQEQPRKFCSRCDGTGQHKHPQRPGYVAKCFVCDGTGWEKV